MIEQIPLTPAQRPVFEFIRDFIDSNGHSPSHRDILAGTEIKSLRSVHEYVHRLRDRGHITFNPKMRNSIRIVSPSLPAAAARTLLDKIDALVKGAHPPAPGKDMIPVHAYHMADLRSAARQARKLLSGGGP